MTDRPTDPARPLAVTVLTEATLLPTLWRLWRRRAVCVFDVEPLIPGTGHLLAALHARWERAGRLVPLEVAVPRWPHLTSLYSNMERYNAFRRHTDLFAEHFRFAALDAAVGPYAQAVRHVTYNRLAGMIRFQCVLSDLDADRGAAVTVTGADPFARNWLARRLGRRPALGWSGRGRLNRLVNAGLALATTVYGLAWSLGRTRAAPPPPEPVLLASDYISPHHIRFLEEIVDDPADVLVIFRSPAQLRERGADAAKPFQTSVYNSGWLRPAQIPAALGLLLRDGWRLFRHLGHWDPRLFRAVAALPHKRVVVRALLERHAIRHFLGRDDYNVEHILRSQEMRRRGGLSMGMAHGLPVPEIVSPQWSYLDFDVYFTFGRDLYDRHYHQTWAPGLRIRPIGSHGMTLAQTARLGDPRPGNILFLISIAPYGARLIAEMIKVALAFPDVTVFVKMKPSRKRDGLGAELVRLCAEGPDNLVETEENTYDLMLKSRYALTDNTSTVTIETIQYGLPTYVFEFEDVADEADTYYRLFPQITLSSGEEAVARIRALESGQAAYPFADLAGLVDQSGIDPRDQIRDELGLPPRAAPAVPEARRA